MNIKKEIHKGHSKERAQCIADHVSQNPEKFSELMTLYLDEPYRMLQRVSWPIILCLKTNPDLITPYLPLLVKKLQSPVSVALKRNTLRIWQDLDIPKSLEGEVVDICFGYLSASKEPIAIKVFSMTVLLNLTKKIPELGHELQILIEDQLPYGSAGFKSRGRKVLLALKSLPK